MEPGQPIHVVVTYEPGEMRAYVNGEEVLRSDKIQGDLSNWEPMHFIIGDEWEDSRDWKGSVSALGIWSRALSPDEARARFALAK